MPVLVCVCVPRLAFSISLRTRDRFWFQVFNMLYDGFKVCPFGLNDLPVLVEVLYK